jgi:hypothetical protein
MVCDPSGGNITFQGTADSYNKQNTIQKCTCKYDESMYQERFFVGQVSQSHFESIHTHKQTASCAHASEEELDILDCHA